MIISRVQFYFISYIADNLFESRQYKIIHTDELNQSSYFFDHALQREERHRMFPAAWT